MIKTPLTIQSVKADIQSLQQKPVTVKLNLGRNKYVTFGALIDGVYPSLFTVRPDDKNFLGKTAYAYSEVLCGRVAVRPKAKVGEL